MSTISSNISSKILGYYLDSDGKKPAPKGRDGQVIISFGDIVPGKDSRTVMMYLKNEHKFPIQLQARTNDPDLQFTGYPEFLNAQEIGPMSIVFKCPIDRIDPLDTTFGFTVRIMNKIES